MFPLVVKIRIGGEAIVGEVSGWLARRADAGVVELPKTAISRSAVEAAFSAGPLDLIPLEHVAEAQKELGEIPLLEKSLGLLLVGSCANL